MGLFSRRSPRSGKGSPPSAGDPPLEARAEQPAPQAGDDPLAATMPWLQSGAGPVAPAEVPSASPPPVEVSPPSPNPPSGVSPTPQSDGPPPAQPPQQNGNGLSDDLRALFTSDKAVDTEIEALAADLEEVDIHTLARLAREVASLVRR
ncbi:MAG: hypothetical protein NZ951_02895 [Dehalococcoidia bacterium]|nr:hypothetical protein [Dehalococcoidia bacterium]MDW8120120.1 hypothetical protein [Chloroflexota bacterium]